jgi:hypothetical protein
MTPEEVAAAVVYLAGPDAASIIGQVLHKRQAVRPDTIHLNPK